LAGCVPLNAGYSANSAARLGPRALRKPHILAALGEAGVAVTLGAFPPSQIRRPASRLRRGLTLRQQRFVQEYLVCGNAAEAARRIGLGERNAQSNGARLLARRGVTEAVKAEQEASAERSRITADRVRIELARIAFANFGDIADWDAGGATLRPRAAIAPDDRAAIAELRVKQSKHGIRTKIRMHSKLRALDALAKHLGFYLKNGGPPMGSLDEEQACRDANAELRERLLRIARGDGETTKNDQQSSSSRPSNE